MPFRIERVEVPEQDVLDLIARHFGDMRSQSPEESCHVMEADDLFASGARVFVLRDGAETLGIGAIKAMDDAHGELKSMHTKSEARGRGVGAALVKKLMDEARHLGFERLSLETGSEDPFGPARRLYERHGFTYCPPFGDYVEDPLSVFMTAKL